jgi:hypothetical protein
MGYLRFGMIDLLKLLGGLLAGLRSVEQPRQYTAANASA